MSDGQGDVLRELNGGWMKIRGVRKLGACWSLFSRWVFVYAFLALCLVLIWAIGTIPRFRASLDGKERRRDPGEPAQLDYPEICCNGRSD